MDINEKYDSDADLLLNGFNFTAGLIALAAQHSVLKVAIRLKTPVDTSFQPEMSHFYPTSFSQSAKALNNVKFLIKCSSLFQHLYFPQRVLFFQPNLELKTTLNTTFDQLAGRDRELSALAIKTEKTAEYRSLSKFYQRGALVYEYRFDRNRAVVELLKMSIQKGAVLINESTEFKPKTTLNCHPFQSQNFSINIEKTPYPYHNPIRIISSHFEMIFYARLNNVMAQFFITNSSLTIQQFILEVKLILKNLELMYSENIEEKLEQIYWSLIQQSDNAQWEVIDSPLISMRKEVVALQKRVSNQLKKKVNVGLLFSNYPEQAITGANFRFLQNQCDAKFDLAKQTGIGYPAFSYYFYRYRNQIDSMTELAYDMMNEDRNSDNIWAKVESEFLKSELMSFS